MLSSLGALDAAGAASVAVGRTPFQPKVKPRPRKGTKPTDATDQAAPSSPSAPEPTKRPQNISFSEPDAAVTPPILEQLVATATRSAIPKAPNIPAVEAVPSVPPRRRPGKEPVTSSATPPVNNVESVPSSSRTPNKTAESPGKESKRIHSSAPRKRKIIDTLEEVDPSKIALKDLIKFAEAKERKKQKEDAAAKKLEPTPSVTPKRTEEERTVPLAPQVEIVNGKIVINQDSLRVDAINREDTSSYRRIEESQSKLNYHSYLKIAKSKWSKEETEAFYKAVQQFGTDFEVIQKLFPTKSRRQVKAKYKKEEKENPRRMTDTILNPRSDMTQYEELVARLKADAAEKAQAEEEYDFTWNVNTSANQDPEAETEGNENENEEWNNEVDNEDADMEEVPKKEESPSQNVEERPGTPPLFAFQSFQSY